MGEFVRYAGHGAGLLRLVELHDPSGGWHTILNDRRSHIETSMAAFVADGSSSAVRSGWLDEGTFSGPAWNRPCGSCSCACTETVYWQAFRMRPSRAPARNIAATLRGALWLPGVEGPR